MPHSVPHMVQLRKFIVSEDAVFLLLQYAEGKHLMLVALVSLICFFLLSFAWSTSLSSSTSLCPCLGQMFD